MSRNFKQYYTRILQRLKTGSKFESLEKLLNTFITNFKPLAAESEFKLKYNKFVDILAFTRGLATNDSMTNEDRLQKLKDYVITQE